MAKWPVQLDIGRSYFPPGWKLEEGDELIATGGGIQSASLSVLAKKGVINVPKAWIACDTHHEVPVTHLTWGMQRQICMDLGAAFVMLQRPVSITDKFTTERRLPLPHRNKPSCSTWAKRDAFREWIRRRLLEDQGVKRYKPNQFTCIMGISMDEAAERANDSDVKWMGNAYPLVDLRISRRACVQLLKDEWPGPVMPEKSGCDWCPWLGPKGLAKLALENPLHYRPVEVMEESAKPGSGTLFKGMTLKMLRQQVEGGHPVIKERSRPVPGQGQATLQESIEKEQVSCARGGACFT